jgi:hypothetical protein
MEEKKKVEEAPDVKEFNYFADILYIKINYQDSHLMTKGKSVYTPIALFVSPLNKHAKTIRNLKKIYNVFDNMCCLDYTFQDC